MHLRGHDNILKRLLVHAGACSLGLWMRTVCGIGTPRGLQGRVAAMIAVSLTIWNQRFTGIAAVLRRHADHILELASTRRRSAIGTHG